MSIANEIQRLQSAKADIKTAIENKGVTVGDGTLDTFAQKISEISGGGSGDYEQGFEDGKNSVVRLEKFVKTIQIYNFNEFGTKELEFIFDKANIFRSSFTMQKSGADSIYFETNTTVEHLTISTNALVRDMYRMFYCDNYCIDNTMKRITLNFDLDTEYVSTVNLNNAFQNMRGLEIIDGKPLNASNTTSFNSTFSQCFALREIRFIENSIKASINFSVCSQLSTETIQSIIDGLADLTGGTAQTLTLHADVGGKLTDTQKAAITSKNWELVY